MKSIFGVPEYVKRKEGESSLLTVEKFKELCKEDLEMGIGDHEMDIRRDITNPIIAEDLIRGKYPEAYLESVRALKQRIEDLGYLCTDLAMVEFLASRYIQKEEYMDTVKYPTGSPILDYVNMIDNEQTGLQGVQ